MEERDSMNNHPNALVLMTALLPTKGHKNLIWYAISLIKTLNPEGKVKVLICHRSFEPISGEDRIAAFKQEFNQEINQGFVEFVSYGNDNIPQNPADHENFWNIWRDVIQSKTSITKGNIIVSSESYGYELAKVLGCKHYLYDLNREVYSIKSTQVRSNILANYDSILNSFKPYLQTRITMFGAESCGKTTTAKYLHDNLFMDSYYLPEWARPYLESIGCPDVSLELMCDITDGQHSLQLHSQFALTDQPLIIQDTDLLSTIGYYRIMGHKEPERIKWLFNGMRADIYFVMSSNIPFKQDPLRYGGDKRESTDQFWIDLLEEYDCNYIVVNETDMHMRARRVNIETERFIEKKFQSIENFKRE